MMHHCYIKQCQLPSSPSGSMFDSLDIAHRAVDANSKIRHFALACATVQDLIDPRGTTDKLEGTSYFKPLFSEI